MAEEHLLASALKMLQKQTVSLLWKIVSWLLLNVRFYERGLRMKPRGMGN
jgi:hypothetical protein